MLRKNKKLLKTNCTNNVEEADALYNLKINSFTAFKFDKWQITQGKLKFDRVKAAIGVAGDVSKNSVDQHGNCPTLALGISTLTAFSLAFSALAIGVTSITFGKFLYEHFVKTKCNRLRIGLLQLHKIRT